MLDTSTWALLARDESADSRRVINFLSTGEVVPFFTSTVINELFQHGNAEVVERRIGLLRRLPFVSYMSGFANHSSVGWLLDLREMEFAVLRDWSKYSHEEIIACSRSRVVDQFCSGDEFCGRHEEEWMAMRELMPHFNFKTAEIAAIAQFPLPDVDLKKKAFKKDPGARHRTEEEIREYAAINAGWFADKLRKDGDKRIKDPEHTAAEFLNEMAEDMIRILREGGDPVNKMLTAAGVEKERLPEDPTLEDISFENHFVNQLKTHERRLKLPRGTLKQFVRQEQVPSWVVWKEISKQIRLLQKSEASSLNDKMLVPFALYLDAVEVDKRIRNCVRQSAKNEPLVQIVDSRVFRRKNLPDLVADIEDVLKFRSRVSASVADPFRYS